MKKKVFDIIQIGDKSNKVSRAFDYFILANILLNISVMFFLTFEGLSGLFGVFKTIEYVTTIIFCIEYGLRIWTAPYLYRDKPYLRFLLSYDGIVDLLTILPVFFLTGFVVFRMLRVVRILHLFRINAQYDSFNVITEVLKKKRNQIISSVFIIVVLLLASSLCMYSAEHEAQPGVFENAFSGIWWAVSTVLTVGYGDIYPVTILGRCMAILIAFLGVGVVAIPTGIISAGFVEQYTHSQSVSDNNHADLEEILEIQVDKRFAKRTVAELRKNEHLHIYMILREDMTVIPMEDTRLLNNDIIICKFF